MSIETIQARDLLDGDTILIDSHPWDVVRVQAGRLFVRCTLADGGFERVARDFLADDDVAVVA